MSQFRFARMAALLAALILPAAQLYAADTSKKEEEETARIEVGKPLNAVAELLAAKKYDEALAKVAEAEKVSKLTPYEKFFITRSRAAIASAAGNNELLTTTLETLVTEFKARLSKDELRDFMKNLAFAYYNKKDFVKSAEWLQAIFKDGYKDAQLHGVLIQAYYLNNDFANALKEGQAELADLEKAGKVPEETQINLVRNCAVKLKDNAAFTAAIDKLLVHYPSQEYWETAMDRLDSSRVVAERLALDAYRLRVATVKSLSEGDTKDMADLANLAVLPAEAKKAMELGFANGVLNGVNAAANKKLLEKYTKSASDDLKTIAQGEDKANKSKEGNALVNVGLAYVTHGQAEKGIMLIEQGIKVGKLKQPEDTKLHLAWAYVQANRKDDAIATLKTITGGDGLQELVRYWLIFLGNKK